MVKLDVVKSCNTALVKAQPLVAVFVGSTSGIGEYSVRALAARHADQGRGLRLYIVGRNAEAAKKSITDCSNLCPNGRFRFVKAEDLALLRDVDRVCAEIVRLEEGESPRGRPPRVDLLVMTQAIFNFQPRKETKEGLDMTMSLLYYSRMRFILKLLPLLLASPLPAHVVSVYGAGLEEKLFPEDLSLRDPKHYSFANLRSHVVWMTTFFMETLAGKYRGQLSLTHIFPSLVMTNAFSVDMLPTWFKVIWRLLRPILELFSVQADEIGERIVFLATPRFPAQQDTGDGKVDSAARGSVTQVDVAMGSDGSLGSGAYRVNWNDETIPEKPVYKKVREQGMAAKVWVHTMAAFDKIEAGGVFAD